MSQRLAVQTRIFVEQLALLLSDQDAGSHADFDLMDLDRRKTMELVFRFEVGRIGLVIYLYSS